MMRIPKRRASKKAREDLFAGRKQAWQPVEKRGQAPAGVVISKVFQSFAGASPHFSTG